MNKRKYALELLTKASLFPANLHILQFIIIQNYLLLEMFRSQRFKHTKN